ncbi:vesicle-associated membrane protein-associated protein Scs2p [[Candida] railenensis]|uniref:Vesicle-associated membrane protein-associated protein Scs2p n=1 Tax=[Candida] railenensis TaxID=45579 RepID=A0A9P0QR14_9ASCO|nr:vesicle-associated membrane protein-associated protein Scs2p [[Candida] railenensis]
MEISPSVLEFSGSFTQPTTEYLSLTNNSDIPLAYKVKTTAPKLYCVRPNASIIEPGATVKVSIILQGFAQPLPADYKCKDKFLLVSLPCPDLSDSSKVSESWSQLEAQYKDQIVSKKLRVSYLIGPVSDPDGPAIIRSSNPDVSGINGPSKDTHVASDLQKELDESTSRINNLSEKLDSNEKTSSSTSTATAEQSVSGFSIPFAIILIVLAFILGWILL